MKFFGQQLSIALCCIALGFGCNGDDTSDSTAAGGAGWQVVQEVRVTMELAGLEAALRGAPDEPKADRLQGDCTWL